MCGLELYGERYDNVAGSVSRSLCWYSTLLKEDELAVLKASLPVFDKDESISSVHLQIVASALLSLREKVICDLFSLHPTAFSASECKEHWFDVIFAKNRDEIETNADYVIDLLARCLDRFGLCEMENGDDALTRAISCGTLQWINVCAEYGEDKHFTVRKMANDKSLVLSDNLQLSKKYHIPLSTSIGKGGFGTLMRITRWESGNFYAMKYMFYAALDKKNRALLKSEVQMLYELDSPYLLSLVDVTFNGLYFVIVTDYCAGDTLLTRMNLLKWKLDDLKIMRYVFSQILKALEYLAQKKIIHRDVKLENIMFVNPPDASKSSEDGWALKLINMGFAVSVESELVKGRYGTLPYMAPEVVSLSSYGTKADVWSAGVVFYSILSEGWFPFGKAEDADGSEAVYALFARIVNRQFEVALSEEYDCEARHLTYMMLMVDDSVRISAKQALNHAFFKGLNESSISSASHPEVVPKSSVSAASGLAIAPTVSKLATTALKSYFDKERGIKSECVTEWIPVDADAIVTDTCPKCYAKMPTGICFYCNDKYVSILSAAIAWICSLCCAICKLKI